MRPSSWRRSCGGLTERCALATHHLHKKFILVACLGRAVPPLSAALAERKDGRVIDDRARQWERPSGVATLDAAGDGVNRLDNNPPADHFINESGLEFAGRHLIIDFYGADRLDDLDHIARCLRQAATAAGATVLNVDLHHFTPNNGVSGVAVLAESHISIHTWPERRFAALDIFMCGSTRPQEALAVLKACLVPERVTVKEHRRGATW